MKLLEMVEDEKEVKVRMKIVLRVEGTPEECEQLMASLRQLVPSVTGNEESITPLDPETTLTYLANNNLLSMRAYNILEKSQIKTLKELSNQTERSIASKKNLGKSTLNEIRTLLGINGLDFKA